MEHWWNIIWPTLTAVFGFYMGRLSVLQRLRKRHSRNVETITHLYNEIAAERYALLARLPDGYAEGGDTVFQKVCHYTESLQEAATAFLRAASDVMDLAIDAETFDGQELLADRMTLTAATLRERLPAKAKAP